MTSKFVCVLQKQTKKVFGHSLNLTWIYSTLYIPHRLATNGKLPVEIGLRCFHGHDWMPSGDAYDHFVCHFMLPGDATATNATFTFP